MNIYKRGGHWHLDATIHGVRYRETLSATGKAEATAAATKRVAEIHAGKGSSHSGREFARKPFGEAADIYLEERKLRVAPRTIQFEQERLVALRAFFGQKPVFRIKAEHMAAYQVLRSKLVAPRTVNMETGVLRRILKRAKVWSVLADDAQPLPEAHAPIARVLTSEEKRRLFDIAAGNPEWLAAYCAAVLAVSTTCRGVELKNLRWSDVDLFDRTINIQRSKTSAGLRKIPLNSDSLAALSRLLERAEKLGSNKPEHYVFPACENAEIDPAKPQKSWRTAWRKITLTAGLPRMRFHDLRHQAITELAEAGASDATLMALAGHMSRRMIEHYSHVRMNAKREALEKLESGLIESPKDRQKTTNGKPV